MRMRMRLAATLAGVGLLAAGTPAASGAPVPSLGACALPEAVVGVPLEALAIPRGLQPQALTSNGGAYLGGRASYLEVMGPVSLKSPYYVTVDLSLYATSSPAQALRLARQLAAIRADLPGAPDPHPPWTTRTGRSAERMFDLPEAIVQNASSDTSDAAYTAYRVTWAFHNVAEEVGAWGSGGGLAGIYGASLEPLLDAYAVALAAARRDAMATCVP
jgi:hypothetical protein